MVDILFHFRLGLADQMPMPRQNQTDIEFEQSLQRLQIVGHIAVRRSDHGRAVAENIVAAEQHLIPGLVKATMAGFMARRVKHSQLATAERDPIVVVVLKVLAAKITSAGTMNTELSAATLSQRQGTAAMVAMNMGQENLFDLLRPHRLRLLDYSVHVRIRAQRHIDNQDVLLTDNVLIRPL